ncbi:MAG TPA: amine dehydrogenase large subunit [Candidatus Dormibacteraeota bacterium]|nr:amine dehydrogenase large subunit [Candidatus Dormibacteraeota bacterium]
MRRLAAALVVVGLLLGAARAEVAPEHTGQVESIPQPPQPHWVWTADLILQRSAVMDADDGRFLGMINGGYGTVMPLFARTRPEIYVPATYYSRGTHGTRTDVVEIYDTEHLAVQGEVVIPPKRATNAVALAHAALSDDDRFVAIFNWTTGTSLSIVDVRDRRFAAEIETPGCSLVYPTGPRRFLSLCADGSVFTLTLNDDGSESSRGLSKPFMDPKVDPVTEKAVRIGNQWLFVSFDGIIHPVDGSGPEPVFGPTWSLLGDADKNESWRIGGHEHLAVHRASGRLYALMHRGGADTHKDPGEEVWVFDIASQRRVARIPLVNPGFTVYGFPISTGGTVGRFLDWLLDRLAPPLIHFIAVTQDAHPLLVTSSQFSGMLGVYNAENGAFLRRVGPTGWTSDVLQAPWGGP